MLMRVMERDCLLPAAAFLPGALFFRKHFSDSILSTVALSCISSGPLNLVFGICTGLVVGQILSCTRIWCSPYRRSAATYITTIFFAYLYYHWGFRGAGPLNGVMTGR